MTVRLLGAGWYCWRDEEVVRSEDYSEVEQAHKTRQGKLIEPALVLSSACAGEPGTTAGCFSDWRG